MEVTREELNPCTIKLTIACDAEQVREGFSKAIKKIGKKIKLPGFRPGHAPRSMLEGLISPEELLETAADNIVRATFTKVLEQQELKPDESVRPTVDIETLDRDKEELTYSAKVPLPAQVTLGEYRGLPVKRPRIDVTDEQIDAQIEEMRKRRVTRGAVTDRGVEIGDNAVVSYHVEGNEGEERTAMVVAGQSFPSMDEALAGMKVEDIKNVELTFPEDFEEKDLAGQTHRVQLTLNSLTGVHLPELDDAFAKSLRSESVEDLRERVRIALINAKKQMVREVVNEQLLERLLERSTVHVSDNMWEALAAQRIRETEIVQHEAGKTLKEYAEENGMTLEQLHEAWMSKSKLYIERALLIREVFFAEKMQLNNEELTTQLEAMAEEYEMSVDELVTRLKKERAGDELQFRAISAKVTSFLDSNAVDAPVEAEGGTATEAPVE
jgi:trigger factor